MLRYRSPVYLALALAPALLAAGTTARADEVFKATSFVTGFGSHSIKSFDISFVDPRRPVYLLADRTNAAVDVVDTRTNKLVKMLTPGFVGASPAGNDFSGPNGVLIAENNDIWVGDGASKMWVIDLGSGQVDTQINTGGVKRADELCFDPDDHIILMANDADSPPFITFWDSRKSHHFQNLGRITFDGATPKTPHATNGIEQCQYDPRSHRFLLNLPEINGPGDNTGNGAVAVINPHDLTKPERIFVLDHNKCAGPQGMAIGPDHQVLLGCNAPSGITATNPNGNGNFSTVVIDDDADRILATINNESGADEVWFNPGDGHYFLGRSGAVPPPPAPQTQFLGVIDSLKDRADPSVPTATKPNPPAASSHSVAADPLRNQVYVPIGANSGTTCSSVGGSDALGCIAVYTTKHDDEAMNRDHDHDHDHD
jgi:hypothetical protein